MLQVELEAPDGTPLNLKEGAVSTLEFTVPESLNSKAPAVIPLWSYNEENGYWIEEGQATLVDDKYIGEVTHFSTWNVDFKIDPVDICGIIIANEDGREINLPYFQINLSGESFQSVGGWLCEDGTFRFINVPSGEIFIKKNTSNTPDYKYVWGVCLCIVDKYIARNYRVSSIISAIFPIYLIDYSNWRIVKQPQ